MRLILTLFLYLFLFLLSTITQAQNATSKLITQSYLDSTRSLTKGSNKLNAAYLALAYNFSNIDSVEWIYHEIKVPKGEAPLRTYYCVIQGYGYYCGLQVNSKKERRIIFSAWDSASGNNNKSVMPEKNHPVLLAAGEGVVYNRFGGEGSGIHTHRVFNWKEDSTYRFLIHSVPDLVSKTTTITLFVEDQKNWKLIAKLRRPECIGYEKGAASFMEDFSSRDDEHRRAGSFQNFWVRKVSGVWTEITRAYYYLPFGDKNRQEKDHGCGISTSGGFMLVSGGGFTDVYLPAPVWLKRDASGKIPLMQMPE